jgi:transposase
MGKHKQAFVAFDSAKEKYAVAIADDGRDGEVRYLVRSTIRRTPSGSW